MYSYTHAHRYDIYIADEEYEMINLGWTPSVNGSNLRLVAYNSLSHENATFLSIGCVQLSTHIDNTRIYRCRSPTRREL